MLKNPVQDRAEGALFGALIGDALGIGPHWYYSLEELHRDYGDWIDRYTDPKPGRYHDSLENVDNLRKMATELALQTTR